MDTLEMNPIAAQLKGYFDRDEEAIEADKMKPPVVYAQLKGKEFGMLPNTWVRLNTYTVFGDFGITTNLDEPVNIEQRLIYEKLKNFRNQKPEIVED